MDGKDNLVGASRCAAVVEVFKFVQVVEVVLPCWFLVFLVTGPETLVH